MGQTIGWKRYDQATGKSERDERVPERFRGKWAGRFEWFQSLYVRNNTESMPGDDDYLRSIDFDATRKHLDEIPDNEVIAQHWPSLDMADVRRCWKECTDYLEAHPDVFVDYS